VPKKFKKEIVKIEKAMDNVVGDMPLGEIKTATASRVKQFTVEGHIWNVYPDGREEMVK